MRVSTLLLLQFAAWSRAAPISAPTEPSPVPSGAQYTIVDDYSTQWTLAGGWGTFGRSADNYCDSCLVQPDHSKVQGGTWSETSEPGASATLSFDGVGVNVYVVCPGHISIPSGGEAIYSGEFSFKVDGADAGSWSIDGSQGCTDYVYNTLVFSKSDLADGSHTFTITNGGSGSSDLVLDFAVIESHQEVTTTSTSTTSTTTTTTTSDPPSESETPVTPPPGQSIPSGPVPSGPSFVHVDDQDAAWNYDSSFGSFTKGSICEACLVKPDPDQLEDGSWHEASAVGTATLRFTGQAVSIYGVCPGPISLSDNNTAIFSPNFTFTLDGTAAGSLSIEGGCDKYVYSHRIFHQEGLDLGDHVFTVTNGGGTSDLIIDYAVVDVGSTTTTPPTEPITTTSTSSTTTTTPDPPALPPAGIPPASPKPPSGSAYIRLDDASPQVMYTGAGWGTISKDDPCTVCQTKFDFTQLSDATYHELTGEGSATVTFVGTEIYVYGACPGTLDGGGQYVQNFAFDLDGKTATPFKGLEGGCSKYVYSQLFFKATGLSSKEHTLTIKNVQGGQLTSDLVIDFFVIKSNGASQPGTPVDPPTSDPPTGTPPSLPPASPAPPTGDNFVIIDDASSAVKYVGEGWGQISESAPCTGCQTSFDFKQLSAGTYHELASTGSATLTFSGKGVWVYGVCPGTIKKTNGQYVVRLAFSLDGTAVGNFNSPAGGCSKDVYKQLLFTASNLKTGTHTLTISNLQSSVQGALTSDLVLDFFVIDSAGTTQPGGGGGQPGTTGPPAPSAWPGSPAAPSGKNFLRLDDTSAQIAYHGDSWGAISKTAQCSTCMTKFDYGKLNGGTYHELSSPGSASIAFFGRAIYVYGVCPGTLKPAGQYLQAFSLSIDGGSAASFKGPAGGCTVNAYNQLLFKVENLSSGQHTAVISNLNSGFAGNPSDLVLDYVVIDTAGLEQPSAPPTDSPPAVDGNAPPKASAWPASPAPPTGGNYVQLDDTSAQISYTGSWGSPSKDAPCTSCATQFAFDKLYQNTYHELSTAGSASISFSGQAIYIYGVCPGTLELGGQFLQAFSLKIDDGATAVPDFHGPAGGCSDNAYNQLLFKVEGLSVGPHVAVISNLDSGYASNPSDLVLDFVVIDTAGLTQPEDGASSSDPVSSRPTSGTFLDDTDSSWSFSGSFGAISAVDPCETCLAKPDPTKAYQSTWRDLSSAGSAALSFKASSVSVFVICPGPLDLPDGGKSFFRGVFNVSLDGVDQPQWTAPESGCSQTVYDVLIANVTGLDASVQHTLVVTNVQTEGEVPSDLMLDYAVLDGIAPAPDATPSDTGSAPGPTAPPESGAPQLAVTWAATLFALSLASVLLL